MQILVEASDYNSSRVAHTDSLGIRAGPVSCKRSMVWYGILGRGQARQVPSSSNTYTSQPVSNSSKRLEFVPAAQCLKLEKKNLKSKK